ncbi:MAG: hypothetical protein ACE5ET_00430 [Gammaproteobacteria bacterium]
MSVYSVDKLIAEARRLAADYRRATGRPLAGVSSEVCQHDAARLLDLEICDSPMGGYDALGKGERAGKRIQIKGRAIFDERKSGYRIGQLKVDQEWDSVMLVLMDGNLEPFEIYEAEREDILADLEQAKAKGKRRASRGAMSVARFKNIAHLVWTREHGVEDGDIWDNQSGA